MIEIEITGTEQLTVLAAKFRAAADGGLQAELTEGLYRSTTPLTTDARMSALDNLPRRGGLNRIVAGARMTVERGPMHVVIVAKGIPQLALTNAGEVVHPVYGHRPREHQLIPKARNWFFGPMRRGKDKVERELREAMRRVAKDITS